jgi:hypothetical protein
MSPEFAADQAGAATAAMWHDEDDKDDAKDE